MKHAIGIARKCDPIGRIVIPVEYRHVLKLDCGESVEVFTEEETIILKKYAPPLRSMRGGTKNRDLSRRTHLLQMYTGAKGTGASSCGKSMIVAHGS